MKSFRNAMLSSDIECTDGVASWDVVRELYNIDQKSSTRMCPKLTEKHVNPIHFDKMKVKLATQIFSRSVVAGVKTVAELNLFSESTKSKVYATWNLFDKLDKLFDILNSKHMFHKNKFKSGLTCDEASETYTFLINIVTYLKKIKLVNNKKVFSFDGLVQTINGVIYLIRSLITESNCMQYLLTSRLNQDALENAFALIRCAIGNNFNPSVQEFSFTVAKLLSIKYLTTFTTLANCEEDNDANLLDIIRDEMEHDRTNQVNVYSEIENNTTPNFPFEVQDKIESSEVETDHNHELEHELSELELNCDVSTRYFVGLLTQKVFKKYNCANCALVMAKPNHFLECKSELLIHYKNYLTDTFGKLQTPSTEFFDLCRRQINQFDIFFKNKAHVIGLKQQITQILINNETDREFYNQSHCCFEHRTFILNLMIVILIRKHSKWYIERVKKENMENFGLRKAARRNKVDAMRKDRRWQTIIN